MPLIKATLDQELIRDLIRCLALGGHINDSWSLRVSISRDANNSGYLAITDLHYDGKDKTFFIGDVIGSTIVSSDIEVILKTLVPHKIVELTLHTFSDEPILESLLIIRQTINRDIMASHEITVFLHTDHPRAITASKAFVNDLKDLSDEVPIVTDEKLGPIRHGVTGKWYIRQDGEPLLYQYWLLDQLVTEEVYESYITSCHQLIEDLATIPTVLQKLINTYID